MIEGRARVQANRIVIRVQTICRACAPIWCLMVSLHFLYYNFGRVHSSLGKLTTPAMAAGLSGHVWACEEIVALID